MSDLGGASTTKIGIISCSGEEIPEGTVSRLATRRVLERLRPGTTVTLCLPLFLAGNEGERNFARTHPTITVDGCEKQCARWGTEKHGGPVSRALVVSDILGDEAGGCSRSTRARGQADERAVATVADRIAAEVDAIISEGARPEMDEDAAMDGSVCACMRPVETGSVSLRGGEVEILALPRVFAQCAARGMLAEEGNAPGLLEMVKVFHYVAPEEEDDYKGALIEAYDAFLSA
jgi:hypothetical protein